VNAAPIVRLGHNPDGELRTPLEAMTGRKPTHALHRIVPDEKRPDISTDIQQARLEQVTNIDSTIESLEALHKDVERRAAARREQSINAHNRATNIVSIKFAVGDFVLVRVPKTGGHKCAFKWQGPRRVTEVVSDYIYVVSPLEACRDETVHAARLMPYRSRFEGTEVPQTVIDLADHVKARFEIIEKILDLGRATDGLFAKVQWPGLPDSTDHTWHPIAELYADVPDLLVDLLRSTEKKALASQAANQLGITI